MKHEAPGTRGAHAHTPACLPAAHKRGLAGGEAWQWQRWLANAARSGTGKAAGDQASLEGGGQLVDHLFLEQVVVVVLLMEAGPRNDVMPQLPAPAPAKAQEEEEASSQPAHAAACQGSTGAQEQGARPWGGSDGRRESPGSFGPWPSFRARARKQRNGSRPPGPRSRHRQLSRMHASSAARGMPSPTLSPTDPVHRGLLTLCPAASSGPQGR